MDSVIFVCNQYVAISQTATCLVVNSLDQPNNKFDRYMLTNMKEIHPMNFTSYVYMIFHSPVNQNLNTQLWLQIHQVRGTS